MESDSGFRVRLMGTVEARQDGRSLVLSGRRVRVLLAVLALSAGHAVPVERIAGVLWDSDPPVHVRGSVQTCVARLRRVIGTDRVITEPHGYRLAVPRSDVDLLAFADRIEQAKHAGSEAAERELLESAIQTWSDSPFGDSTCPWLERYETARWVERHLQAVERCADLDLAAGRHVECALMLGDLVAQHPLRETLGARWLIALHRSGRTADALIHYDEIRTGIADELGVDPSAELRAVHADLLRRDTDPPQPRLGESAATTPHLLPVDLRGFSGRTALLEQLDEQLGDGPGGLVALHGPGGAGKTALAVHWMYQAADRFPDGEVLVNLRGYGTGHPLDAMEALGVLLRAVGVPGHSLPADQTQREALWRNMAGHRRLLVLLDNARDSAQVQPLLPGGQCLVLVTSRSQLRGLATRQAARRIAVGAMSEREAHTLLASRLGMTTTPTESGAGDDGLAELASLCGYLPLALAIAAERAGRDQQRSMDAVIAPLRDDRERLHELTVGDDDPMASMEAVFDWSYDTLSAEAAHVLRLLGLAPEAKLAVESVAALAGAEVRATARLLDQLVDRHLLIEQQQGWYEIHDLTRAYARDLTNRLDSPAEREDAIERLRSWYTHTALRARTLIAGSHPAITLGDPAPGVGAQEFSGTEDAFRWFLDHRRAITAMVTGAADSGAHATVYTMMPILSLPFSYTGGLHEELRLNILADDCARAAGDARAQALCATNVGSTYARSRNYSSAREWFSRSLALSAKIGDRAGELHAMMAMTPMLITNGEVHEAVRLLEKTLEAARELGLVTREAATLNNLAIAYSRLGRHDEAVAAAERSLTVDQRLGDPLNEAMGLDTLGDVRLEQGAYVLARQAFLDSVAIHQRLGDNTSYACALRGLGRAEQYLGDAVQARQHWREALDLLDRINAADNYDISRANLRALLAGSRDGRTAEGNSL